VVVGGVAVVAMVVAVVVAVVVVVVVAVAGVWVGGCAHVWCEAALLDVEEGDALRPQLDGAVGAVGCFHVGEGGLELLGVVARLEKLEVEVVEVLVEALAAGACCPIGGV